MNISPCFKGRYEFFAEIRTQKPLYSAGSPGTIFTPKGALYPAPSPLNGELILTRLFSGVCPPQIIDQGESNYTKSCRNSSSGPGGDIHHISQPAQRLDGARSQDINAARDKQTFFFIRIHWILQGFIQDRKKIHQRMQHNISEETLVFFVEIIGQEVPGKYHQNRRLGV